MLNAYRLTFAPPALEPDLLPWRRCIDRRIAGDLSLWNQAPLSPTSYLVQPRSIVVSCLNSGHRPGTARSPAG